MMDFSTQSRAEAAGPTTMLEADAFMAR